MTKKHFTEIARILKETKANQETVQAMADFLQTMNNDFKRCIFVAACKGE